MKRRCNAVQYMLNYQRALPTTYVGSQEVLLVVIMSDSALLSCNLLAMHVHKQSAEYTKGHVVSSVQQHCCQYKV